MSAAIVSESDLERRMQQALARAWKYVDQPYVSEAARKEIGPFVRPAKISGKRIPMLFAMQTAWVFVHAAGDRTLVDEFKLLMRAAGSWHTPSDTEKREPKRRLSMV